MNAAATLLALIEIAQKAYAAIQQIRTDSPEAFAQVSENVVDSLERAKTEALKPDVPAGQ